VFNGKLHRVMNNVDSVKIIQANLGRNDFTLAPKYFWERKAG